jgi:hypothetical protein
LGAETNAECGPRLLDTVFDCSRFGDKKGVSFLFINPDRAAQDNQKVHAVDPCQIKVFNADVDVAKIEAAGRQYRL